MTPEELYNELREAHKMGTKDSEALLRRACTYLEEHNFQWNRNKLIETNLALKFLLMRCLALELMLQNRQTANLELCGE